MKAEYGQTITPEDVLRYNRAQLRKALINLTQAERRNDTEAATNIQRKVKLFEYTINMVQCYIDDGKYINKKIEESGD